MIFLTHFTVSMEKMLVLEREREGPSHEHRASPGVWLNLSATLTVAIPYPGTKTHICC